MLTTDHINDGYDNPQWCGVGYLGERTYLPETTRRTADKVVLRHANDRGWTPEVFFEWLNSKCGRWFCDHTYGRRWTQRDLYNTTGSLFDDIESWMPANTLATLTTEN